MTEAGILSGLSMAAAAALALTGVWLWRQPAGNRTKAVLMVVAGLVIVFNVWISGLPLTPSAH